MIYISDLSKRNKIIVQCIIFIILLYFYSPLIWSFIKFRYDLIFKPSTPELLLKDLKTNNELTVSVISYYYKKKIIGKGKVNSKKIREKLFIETYTDPFWLEREKIVYLLTFSFQNKHEYTLFYHESGSVFLEGPPTYNYYVSGNENINKNRDFLNLIFKELGNSLGTGNSLGHEKRGQVDTLIQR